MTTIGSFKASGNEFIGEIATLTIQAKAVRIIPAKKTTDGGPSHRVYAGQVEVGAAWSKVSKEKRPYLSVRLDDPSLIAPVYANLLADENGKSHNLIWSRGTRRDRD